MQPVVAIIIGSLLAIIIISVILLWWPTDELGFQWKDEPSHTCVPSVETFS